jgi:CheY-like chemotaxis protein/predicted regulator of Ras-like GTPase activity (Roadblock/LC7/MglB family)
MSQEKNILIVDDDIELGDLLAKAVRDMSNTYNVRIARNVDEAMVEVRKSQTASELRFDLVITDIKMAGLSGLELLEAMNSIAPDTKTIAMTAYNSSDIADRAKELSVEAYLTKPFIISEFRQIVRTILDAQKSTGEGKPSVSLSSDQKVAVGRLLASLRTMTGASAALLMYGGGSVVAIDALDPDTSMDSLCATLEHAQKALSAQMGQTFAQSCQVRQSYFGTETFSICAYRLDSDYTAVVVFGPAVKEGQVWYYLRDAANTLRRALTGEVPTPKRRRRAAKGDVFEMLDQLLPERPRRGRKDAEAAPVQEQPPPRAKEEPAPPEEEPALTETDLESLDEIDWGASPSMDWDAVVQGTDQGFEGMSMQEAQAQGLLPEELAPAGEAATPEAAPDRPPVSEIDFDINVDLDWDNIVDETDKGLGGISFEEAQRQGLVDSIDED